MSVAATLDIGTDAYPAQAVLEMLGGVRWYLSDPASAALMDQAEPDLPADMSDRSNAHGTRLMNDPEFEVPLTPLLPGLSMPALLMTGRADLVCSPDQIDSF